MDLIVAKFLSGLVFFLITIFFGLAPYLCYRRCQKRNTGKKRSVIMQCLSSMASGVLIATCLLHLLPESLEAVKEAFTSRYIQARRRYMNLDNSTLRHMTNSSDCEDQLDEDRYPVAELLVALGFLCVFLVESGIKSYSTGKSKADHDDVFAGTRHTDSKETTENMLAYASATRKDTGQTSGHWWREHFQVKLKCLKLKLLKSSYPYKPVLETDREFELENEEFSENGVTDYSQLTHGLLQQHAGSLEDMNKSLVHPSSFAACPHASKKTTKWTGSNQLRSVALVSALCIHGFFDGVMLGLQTSISVVFSLLLAMSLHKSFVTVGLSLNLMTSSDKPASILLSILLFATAAPLGALVSALLLHETVHLSTQDEFSIIPGCLQSFAVGTFMYVSFSETTKRQHKRTLSVDIVNHVFLFVGFGFMAGLRVLVGSS